MIAKEEILRLAAGMAGPVLASEYHGDATITETVQACFDAILRVAQKECIRVGDGGPSYIPEIKVALREAALAERKHRQEAALAEQKRRIEADNKDPWTPF